MVDKVSVYELQKIDCNCNDCGFMVRDFEKFKVWEAFHRKLQEIDFERKKAHAYRIANECIDHVGKETLLFAARKMRFMFDREGLINYGHCNKFNKPVSFLPGICQIETQGCFIHRKDGLVCE